MIRIVDGRRYNTDTAEELCILPHGRGYPGDFGYENTSLFRTQKGAFFLAGEGGALTRWARPAIGDGTIGGEGILPIDPEEALRHLEEAGASEAIEEYFADEVEDA